jgi:cyclopropane fatty-acyl-phospholipid synthase-like methyltransferase
MTATATKVRKQPAAAISAADAKRAKVSNYIPLKIRFQAWWEGVDAATLMKRQRKAQRQKSSADIKIDQPVGTPEADKTEFELLMSIRERVWGKDFIVPGGLDYATAFLDAAKLKPGSVVLDLSAGLGGSGRAIAVSLDAVVEGFETNEVIAKLGAARATHLALEKQAPISHYLAHNPFLRVDRYDCVYGHEVFYRVLDKQNLFTEIRKSMKEDSHLIFTDLIYAAIGSENTEEIKAWCQAESETPDPWMAENYKAKLTELGFEIVAFDDRSARYQEIIRDGWSKFADTIDEAKIDRRFVDVMMHQAKIWQCRKQALKAGHLQFVRIHARRAKADKIS